MLIDSGLKSLRSVSWRRGVRRLRRAANAFRGAEVSAYAAAIWACPCCSDMIKAQHSVRFLAAKKYEKNGNSVDLWQIFFTYGKKKKKNTGIKDSLLF